ncbi:NGG1p interacting factor NIF3 [Marinomonas rhizomae]|uniref:NGG1p interacting factor NIF3 n=1 Tax=Marinomonas rhizomae TaxID=491948 RepID=A0A366IZ85_9GAMM|nr:NGG1p interacting factor NIF3 [Marinomonas rhizomae]RBP80002.1 hypothetical protein DFP80_11258 [Marinomonas rhizomae]RNF71933.1 NGG1p interacting factor NIF3 [Marinomonas rhizomae]
MYSLVFYVPESHLESVKQAVFSAGAGSMGDYDSCCWQIKGQGQFRPVEGATPFLGKVDELEVVDEYRVEMVLSKEVKARVLAALLLAHPYEEVAYHFIPVQY